MSFLQNHDQVGNRAFGERLTRLAPAPAVKAATAILLLAPSPPLLFMGQEWGATQPFPFFCDFGGELADAVTAGRRREFARFPEFSDPRARERIPDPNAEDTFTSACLDWNESRAAPARAWRQFHSELLAVRRRVIVPRLHALTADASGFILLGDRALRAHWRFDDGARLTLLANLSDDAVSGVERPPGELMYALPPLSAKVSDGHLPAWSVWWFLDHATGGRS